MAKFSTLFWKIFFAFWIANIAILIAITYVVFNMVDPSYFKNQQRSRAALAGAYLIRHYESNNKVFNPKTVNLSELSIFPNRWFLDRFFIALSQRDNVLYSHNADKRSDKSITLSMVGSEGDVYRIDAYSRSLPVDVMEVIGRRSAYQLCFILMASLAVSLFLSWTISRPLKRLGKASQKLSLGDLNEAIEKDLVDRRDEVGELARDIQVMITEIEKNVSFQNQLLHDVSHELRAPLARMAVSAGLIEENTDEDGYAAKRIIKDSSRINGLIQSLLDYSRISYKSLERKSFDFSQLLASSIDNVHVEFPGRKISTSGLESKITVLGYQEPAERAVDNILRNACKYSPGDSGIHVDLRVAGVFCVVVVRDRGPGIKEEEREKLMVPFFRSKAQENIEGFGLGLSIAKRAVEQHEGDIILFNHPQGGLEVSLKFKINPGSSCD